MAASVSPKMAAATLEQLLEELLEPDSAKIRQASERLREALMEPDGPEALAEVLRGAERPQIRHLAAVLLRRRLRKFPSELIDRLPHVLVEALERETDSSSRGSLAQLGARLLLLGGLKFWEPVEKWIQEAAKDPQKMEVALRLVGVAVGVAGPALSGFSPAHLRLCRGGLRARGDPKTLGAALGTLGALLGTLRAPILRSLLPDVLEALQELLSLDEDRGADALEILDEFLEVNPESVIPHLRPLLELCLQVAGDECRGDGVRVRALGTLTFLAQKRPKALLRGGLLPLLLRGLLVPLCAQIQPENPDPEESWGGEGRPCPRHGAAQVLDALAQGLPPEKLLKELLPLLEGPARGGSAGGRKGALLALTALARGCGPALRRRYVGVVLGALRAGLGDPDGAVRGAAAAALRELREELEPEVAPVAAEALPRILGEFWDSPNSPSPDPKSWFVLETLLEALGEGVQPWLPQVLPRISAALEAPAGRELGLSALHALACSCGSLPLPPSIISTISALARGGEQQLQALEVMAALGPAQVGEGLLEALQVGLGLAESGDSDATRVTLALLAAVSELLGEGTAPLLPRVLPLLQGALRPPPALPPSDAPDWLLGFHDDEEGAEPMEEDDVIEWAEPEQAEVGGAFSGLAEAALGALGELVENCGSALLPHLEPLLAAILDLTQFPQCRVRGAAYEALGSLSCCGRAPQTGPSPAHQGAFRALLEGLRAEPEVGGALGAVGGVGRILQPPGHAPPEWLEPIGRALCDVIVGQIACLRANGDGDDEEETSQRSELRETASDWLPEVGVAMSRVGVAGTGRGVSFPPRLFRRILPSLLAALADPAHPGARSWAGAVIGQLGHALGAEATPFLPDLGPAFRLAVGDADPEVRANAFYAIGRIGEAVGHAHQEGAWPGAELCCHALRGEGPGRVRDNILGALVRQRGAPLPQVLPLVLGALPISEDFEEEEPVLKFLLGAGPDMLLPHLPKFVGAVGPGLALQRLPPELSQSLLALLRQMGGADPRHFREGVASLDPAHAAILGRMLDDVIGGQ
ncbi:importin-4 isoform X1 [Taeniopygia guttata]|uniref:importin-4 isoform X1 n=1 Tax=Taeniopygia guttata TaxID=59729 RepID=UPI003BB885C1